MTRSRSHGSHLSFEDSPHPGRAAGHLSENYDQAHGNGQHRHFTHNVVPSADADTTQKFTEMLWGRGMRNVPRLSTEMKPQSFYFPADSTTSVFTRITWQSSLVICACAVWWPASLLYNGRTAVFLELMWSRTSTVRSQTGQRWGTLFWWVETEWRQDFFGDDIWIIVEQ